MLAVAWLLLGYFGLLDLGLGRATAQSIAALRQGSDFERAQTFWTALILNVGLGIIIGLLVWPIAIYFFGSIFKVNEALLPEIQAAIPWLVIAVPITTLSGVLTGALQGQERFLELNSISIIGTFLFQLLPLFASIFWTVDLRVLIPIALLARLFALFMLFASCRRYVFKNHHATFLRTQAAHLIRFGGWVTVTSLVGPMMVILDRFIIGALSGAKSVAFYTVPFQLAERSSIISSATASALFPRFTNSTTSEENRLAVEAINALVVVMTPLTVLGILIMSPFLAWWITPDFANESAFVGQIILIGFWINGFARIPYAQLQARARPDLVAKCHLIEVLPYLALLYLGISTNGLIGAALVFAFRVSIDFLLLSYLSGVLKQSINFLIVPILFLGGAFWLEAKANYSETVSLVLFFVVYISVVVAWSWLQAPVRLRRYLRIKFKTSSI